MAATSIAFAPEGRIEDPLAYLPCSTIAAFRAREVIYNHDQACNKIYLVIEGKVKVSRLVDGKHQVVIDIYQQDEFFGESAVLNLAQRGEEAVALENTKLMMWSTAEIDEIIMKRPRLGLALLQIIVQRTMDMSHRIESFSVDSIPRRLARSLIRFADRMGERLEDGSLWMPPLTHELLAQVVGTSREIVTHYMTSFRRQGYLRYSRRGIMLYRDAFQAWLSE
jgi:CRP/FNR family transcriptional regulator